MKKLNIIYEDKELLVISKPSGILTIASAKEKTRTIYHEAREYIKKQNPHNKIYIVHRLDKDTSGVILFAKNEKLKEKFQENWFNIAIKRTYITIVEKTPSKKKDRLINYLQESSTHQVYVTKDQKNGKLAITNYEVLKTNGKMSLLKINIETGRKNQIRSQLQYIGNPIIGDKKYQAKTNPIKRLGLHAHVLKIIHPITAKEMTFEAPIPKSFNII